MARGKNWEKVDSQIRSQYPNKSKEEQDRIVYGAKRKQGWKPKKEK